MTTEPIQLPAGAPILILDDEFLVLWALQDDLEAMGFTAVETSGSVRDALSRIESDAFKFAFLDVNLGKDKSYDVARALMEKGTPFAFVTGYGRAGVEEAFSGVEVLTKPVDRQALERTLAIIVQ